MPNKTTIFLSLCVACSYLDAAAFSPGSSQEIQATIGSTLQSDMPQPLAETEERRLVYYLYISDFLASMITIPTSNVFNESSTISSTYLAGLAPIYNADNVRFGTCSASFLCMQNQYGIFTDISNYLVADNGLIISWLTPSTLANLELDNIINGMVTEAIVTATTKVGRNPFYGQRFNMVVSSDGEKIYFKLLMLTSPGVFETAR
jgi:hypothetical protein